MEVEVADGDLERVRDALHDAVVHHELRDKMNAVLHLTPTRYSPLTCELRDALADVEHMLFTSRRQRPD